MRTRLPLLLACLALLGCPQGPQPQPENGPDKPRPEPGKVSRVEPQPAEQRLQLESPLTDGLKRSRYSRIQMSYTIQRGAEGFTGRRFERIKEDQFSATVLRPQTIRRQYQLSANKVASFQGSRQLGRQTGQTELHGKRVTVQQGESGVEAWDESGPLALPEGQSVVFDLISLRQLLPSRPMQLGESWDVPASALLHVLGTTEKTRQVSGSIRCTYARVVQTAGRRAADIQMTVDVTLTDTKQVQGKIEYRMTTRLQLRGSWLHDIAGKRPLKLDLSGKATLDHTPLRVDFIPPGTEALTKPFHAEGTMTVELRFPS